ncbi:MAG: MBL fold metallo-hydrolase [Gallionella sp.]|jgi:glyoxylase-like metal-dependent hydrolase (beta-lactamase superfamily II)|nr:MBL fold metallo-hydrolase [Gallionella sp.]MCK9353285.1 MBL fold metallo-hydrolase [Gallionella sp.]
MPKHFPSLCLFVVSFLVSAAAQAEYTPKAERVTDNVYAIVGPLGQRSAENDGLNANFGLIVTRTGGILIDSGASRLGAEKLEKAIRMVTDKPVRWVINTGGQDHRWLGNDYFASRGAEIIALSKTAATQTQYAAQQIQSLERFLGDRLKGTKPLPAGKTLDGDTSTLELDGETLILQYTHAHYPGDAMVFLPKRGIVFSGDLVYVDRLLAIMPMSSVNHAQQAFKTMAALKPAHIIPGHGRVCDLAQAQRETGDYYEFLANVIGAAAKEMEPMQEVLGRNADLPAFRHLENYDSLHKANMNRAFTEFESQ